MRSVRNAVHPSLVLLLALATMAGGARATVYVSIGREKNSLWRSFMGMFEEIPGSVVSWSDSLDKEKVFLQNVLKWSQGNKTTKTDVIVAKYCGTNANCQKGVPNIGASFVPAMKAGMAVVFLEYGPDLKKLNASDYAAVRNNTIVVAPNNQAIGFANAGMLCTQAGDIPRSILMLHGNEGHIPCAERTKGFKLGLKVLTECKNILHKIHWELYGNYYRNQTVSKNDKNGQDIMQKMYSVDPTIDTVIACNDDMAIGAAAAAYGERARLRYNEKDGKGEKAGVFDLYIMGIDNISDTRPLIVGSTNPAFGLAKKFNPPSMFSTIEWKRQLVDTVIGMTEIVANSADRKSLFESFPNGWLNQTSSDSNGNTFVFATHKPWLAELCHKDAAINCPEDLRTFMKDWMPLEDSLFGLFTVNQLYYLHPTVRTLGVYISFRVIMLVFAVVLTAAKGDSSIVALLRKTATADDRDLFKHKFQSIWRSNRITGWPMAVALLSAWCSSWQVWSRYDVNLRYDKDWSSSSYGQLLEVEFPITCSTGMNKSDKGVGFLASLMGFLVVFRFVQIYGRALEARSHIESNLSATRIIAVHLNGMIKPAMWDDPRVEWVRRSIAKKLVLMFLLLQLYLTDVATEDDVEHEPPHRSLFMTEEEFEHFKSQWKEVKPGRSMHLRSMYLDFVGSLEHEFMKLTELAAISPTPSMYGQLVGQAANCVATFSSALRCVDMFRMERSSETMKLFNEHTSAEVKLFNEHETAEGRKTIGDKELRKLEDAERTGEIHLDNDITTNAYPMVLTSVAQVVLVYFCIVASMLVGCTVSVVDQPVRWAFVAEPISFFISLAFCTLFEITSQMEDPFGDDTLDFKMRTYGQWLSKDVASLLRVASSEVELYRKHTTLHGTFDKHATTARHIEQNRNRQDTANPLTQPESTPAAVKLAPVVDGAKLNLGLEAASSFEEAEEEGLRRRKAVDDPGLIRGDQARLRLVSGEEMTTTVADALRPEP